MRHGTATAVLANVNRDSKNRPEPYKADDFIWWVSKEVVDEAPIELADPVAHSNLIRAALFGIAPKQTE